MFVTSCLSQPKASQSKVLGVFGMSRFPDERAMDRVFGKYGRVEKLVLLRDRYVCVHACLVGVIGPAGQQLARLWVRDVRAPGRRRRCTCKWIISLMWVIIDCITGRDERD